MISHYKRKNEESSKIISSLKISLRSIYESIECESDEKGRVNQITESNILKYLSDIEDRANEILMMYELCRNKVSG